MCVGFPPNLVSEFIMTAHEERVDGWSDARHTGSAGTTGTDGGGSGGPASHGRTGDGTHGARQ